MRDDSRMIAFFPHRIDMATRIFAVKKIVLWESGQGGRGRGTFYERNAASLVSSTVDIGDCRVYSRLRGKFDTVRNIR